MFPLNSLSVEVSLFSLLWILTITYGLKGQEVKPITVKRPEKIDNSPEICRTLETGGSHLPKEDGSPYEIVVGKIAPSVYEG